MLAKIRGAAPVVTLRSQSLSVTFETVVRPSADVITARVSMAVDALDGRVTCTWETVTSPESEWMDRPASKTNVRVQSMLPWLVSTLSPRSRRFDEALAPLIAIELLLVTDSVRS